MKNVPYNQSYPNYPVPPEGIKCSKCTNSEKRVELDFMVVPEELNKLAYVPDAIKIKIIDSDAIFLTGILGESGKKLVKAGLSFYFKKELAEKLIDKGIAVKR